MGVRGARSSLRSSHVTADAAGVTLNDMAVEPKYLLTYEDFLTFPDDGVRREIIDGEMFVTPSPIVRHQTLVGRLFYLMYHHVEMHGSGQVFVAPLDVRLGEHTVVEPDLIFIAEERRDIVKEKFILGAPTLLVEVVSDPRTDRVRKRDVYARAGVLEYWVVDPAADRVEVHRLVEGRYGKPELLEPGETLTTEHLNGFTVGLTDLFARAT